MSEGKLEYQINGQTQTVDSLCRAHPGVQLYVIDSLVHYIAFGRPVGGFLTAVLQNDLKKAFIRADDNNMEGLFYIVQLLYQDAPSNCWGSPEKVTAWIKAKAEGSE